MRYKSVLEMVWKMKECDLFFKLNMTRIIFFKNIKKWIIDIILNHTPWSL